jgi:carboxyl-terminal processing protease
MKAQIARSNWGEEGFFPVFNQADEIFIKALTLFDQAEQLAERN